MTFALVRGFRIWFLLLVWITASCQKNKCITFCDESSATVDQVIVRDTKQLSAEKNGQSVTTKLSANSDVSQVLNSSDPKLGNVQLVIPPGSLALDTQMEVAQGVDMSSHSTLSGLGLSETTTVAAAGAPVVLRSSVAMDLSTPMQLFLSVPEVTNLTSSTCNLGIIYLMSFVESGKYEQGIYSPDDPNVSIQGNNVILSTSHFGAYQTACFSEPIPAHVKVEVEHPAPTLEEQNQATISLSVKVSTNATGTGLRVEYSPSGYTKVSSCSVVFSQDKKTINATAKTSASPYDWKSTYTTSANVYVQGVCTDSNGLSATSDWVGPFSLASPTTTTSTSTITTSNTTTTSSSTQSTTTSTSTTSTTTAVNITLESVYPTNGNNWNDYIQITNSGVDANHQGDSSCTGTETWANACTHAGERKKIRLNFRSSCSGIQAIDEMGWFDWTCQIEDGKVVFYSDARNGLSLGDLIYSGTWRSNRVSVFDMYGATIARTGLSPWWTNPIQTLTSTTTDNTTTLTSINLASAGTVYIINNEFRTGGINITANKVSLLMKGNSIYYQGTSDSLSTTPNPPTGSAAVISAQSKNFLWIEDGVIKPEGKNQNLVAMGVALDNVKHLRVLNVTVDESYFDAFHLSSVKNSTFENISAYQCETFSYIYPYSCVSLTNSLYNLFKNTMVGETTNNGINLDENSNYNRLYDTYVGNAGYDCISVYSHGNILYNSYASQCSSSGLYISGSYGTGNVTDNIVVGLLATSSANGLKLNLSSNATIRDVTVAYNSSVGIYLSESDHNTIVNSVAYANNTGFNIYSYTATQNTNVFYNLAMSNNTSQGLSSVLYSGSIPNIYKGYLLAGSGDHCTVTGSNSNQGINNDCYAPNLTTGPTIDLSSSFLGMVSSDSSNQVDLDNAEYTASFSAIHKVDWINFDTSYRLWVKASASNVAIAGKMDSGNIGFIYDWRSYTSTPLIKTSVNGSTNPVVTPYASCPGFVYTSIIDYQTNPKTFLVFAQELMRGSSGNRNGLCEEGEQCVITQNWGAYQGYGLNNLNSCSYLSTGSVDDVSLFDLPNYGI